MAIRSPLVCGVLLVIALACARAPLAEAAPFLVTGPAGAEVVLDGDVLGVLPLAGPIDLPHGRVLIVQVRKPGFVTHEEQVFLSGPETEYAVDVELLELSRGTAMTLSALLAGTGQLYQERDRTGWVHMGLQVAAWSSAVFGELVFKDKRDDYERLDQQYRIEVLPSEIARLRAERDAAWSDMEDAKTWRNVGIGTAVAIAAWSVFDAWRGHDRFYAAVQSPADSPDGNATAQVGMTWAFGGGAR